MKILRQWLKSLLRLLTSCNVCRWNVDWLFYPTDLNIDSVWGQICLSRHHWFYWVLLALIMEYNFFQVSDYNIQRLWWLGEYYEWYFHKLQPQFMHKFESCHKKETFGLDVWLVPGTISIILSSYASHTASLSIESGHIFWQINFLIVISSHEFMSWMVVHNKESLLRAMNLIGRIWWRFVRLSKIGIGYNPHIYSIPFRIH